MSKITIANTMHIEVDQPLCTLHTKWFLNCHPNIFIYMQRHQQQQQQHHTYNSITTHRNAVHYYYYYFYSTLEQTKKTNNFCSGAAYYYCVVFLNQTYKYQTLWESFFPSCTYLYTFGCVNANTKPAAKRMMNKIWHSDRGGIFA